MEYVIRDRHFERGAVVNPPYGTTLVRVLDCTSDGELTILRGASDCLVETTNVRSTDKARGTRFGMSIRFRSAHTRDPGGAGCRGAVCFDTTE